MSNKNSIQYCQVSDYNVFNLILPPEEASVTLGKWRVMQKSYLEKHKKALFSTLLMQGKLYQHWAEVENQARDMFNALIDQMKEAEGITEQLKEENQMERVYHMQSIETMARELICYELIFN